jgi:ankyrin repeat protein
LLTSPSPSDETWAKSLLNRVEYRREKAKAESTMTEKLLQAAKENNRGSLTAALDDGADANAKDERGATALMIAAINGHVDVMWFLVGRGASGDRRGPGVSSQDSVSHRAAHQGGSIHCTV